uniref:NADH dehydrogenase (Ubiquinone) 1 alpha subcomplex, 4 n=1 Tax=Nothobranchius pienaari TaxID=704102 RepID=A0A1A8LGN7_9TELE
MEPNQQYKVEIFSKFSMVGAEGIQAPVKFSPFVNCSHLLKSQHPILTNSCRFVKKDKLKYHMVLSNQTLCCDTHIFNSDVFHFF